MKKSVVVKLTDIVGYRFPLRVAQLIGEKVLQYLKDAGDVKKIIILDEVEFPELYELCFHCSDQIIAGGHYLNRDSGKLKDQLQEIDIDAQWPISQSNICTHLSYLLKLCKGDDIINNAIVELVAKDAETLGQAESVLGLLLATYAHRTLIKRRQNITCDDARFWLSVFGTNWFWFSMDCWRVKDPLTTTILHSYRGRKIESIIEIDIKASIKGGLETP